MLRVTFFLGCALVLPALFASGQLDFEFENLVANSAQIPLEHSNNYQIVCQSISRSISPASQVFFPGAVSSFLFSSIAASFMSPLRFSTICGRHRSLGQLELTVIRVFRAARHST